MMSAGVLFGPALGGYLLDTLDWSSIFYARLPLGIIILVMAWIFLKEQKASNVSSKFDLWGAATLFSGMSCLLLFINLGPRETFVSPLVLIFAGGAVVLLSLFIVQEMRNNQPVVDLNLFKNKLFASGSIGMCIMGFGFATLTFLMPFYLIDGFGYSASESGLLLTVTAFARFVVSPPSGWLSDKLGPRLLCTVGMVLLSLGLFLLSRLGIEPSNANILLGLVAFGTGMGMFMSPVQSLIMGAAPKDRLGTASAMISTVRMIGSSTGTAIAGAILTGRQLYHATQLSPNNPDPIMLDRLSLIGGLQDTLLIIAIICTIGIFTSLVKGNKPPMRDK